MKHLKDFLNNFCALNTRISYKRDILEFKAFIGQELCLNQLTIEDYTKYRDHLASKYSSKSINRKLSSLKSFLKWNLQAGSIRSNPLDVLKLPKAQVETPTLAFTDEEVNKIFESMGTETFSEKTHFIILKLLFNLGLRRSELVNIKLEDIRDNTLKVKGKGGKVRFLPINGDLQEIIKAYKETLCNTHNIILEETDFLLQSSTVAKNTQPMAGYSIIRIVKKIAKNIGITRPVGAHSCRATVISHLLEKGISPRDVADFAGHSSVNTTISSYDKKRDGLKNSAAHKVKY